MPYTIAAAAKHCVAAQHTTDKPFRLLLELLYTVAADFCTYFASDKNRTPSQLHNLVIGEVTLSLTVLLSYSLHTRVSSKVVL